MPRRRDEDDETPQGADPDDRDDPDESDMDDDDDPEAVACPYCRRPMSEDADICPHCGNFISFEDAPRRRPWWVVAAVVALMGALLLGWALSFG